MRVYFGCGYLYQQYFFNFQYCFTFLLANCHIPLRSFWHEMAQGPAALLNFRQLQVDRLQSGIAKYKDQLESDVVKYKKQMSTLYTAVKNNYFNNIIQPVPGVYEEEDLITPVAINDLDGGRVDASNRRPPVPMTVAQAERIRLQCLVVASLLAQFVKRDERFLEILRRKDTDATTIYKELKANMVPALQLAEEVHDMLKESCPPSKQVILQWCAPSGMISMLVCSLLYSIIFCCLHRRETTGRNTLNSDM